MHYFTTLALALCTWSVVSAGYYYQHPAQYLSPAAVAPVQQYYSAPVAPQYYHQPQQYYQPPTTAYFQHAFLQQPAQRVVQYQRPQPIESARAAQPAAVSQSAPSTSASNFRGFAYHTDFTDGARSNVVFLNGPAAASFLTQSLAQSQQQQQQQQQQPAQAQQSDMTMRTPASDSVDTIAVEAAATEPAAPVQPLSLDALFGYITSGQGVHTFYTSRVPTNTRFLSTPVFDEQPESLLRSSSFIGRRVTTASDAEGAASERQSKSLDAEVDVSGMEASSTTASSTTEAATSTTQATTEAATTTTSTTTTTTTSTTVAPSSTTTTAQPELSSTMKPIVVADM